MQQRDVTHSCEAIEDIASGLLIAIAIAAILGLVYWRVGASSYCPLPAGMIVGDCDGDGRVASTEWATCWAIENLAVPRKACPACDADGDGVVTREEAGWATGNDPLQLWR